MIFEPATGYFAERYVIKRISQFQATAYLGNKKMIELKRVFQLKMVIIIILIFLFNFLNCSFFFHPPIDDFVYVFQVNEVNWLKKVKIDTNCVLKVQKQCEDSLKVKMAGYACYESNSFKWAIHFLDKKRYFSPKHKRSFKRDYLAIIDDNCNLVKITITPVDTN